MVRLGTSKVVVRPRAQNPGNHRDFKDGFPRASRSFGSLPFQLCCKGQYWVWFPIICCFGDVLVNVERRQTSAYWGNICLVEIISMALCSKKRSH